MESAKEACELCGARAAIQGKYLDQLTGSLGSSHTIVRLPLLPREVRGSNEIAEFSLHMVQVNERLDDSAIDRTYGAATSDADMLATLNALLAKRAKDGSEEDTGSTKKQAFNVSSPSPSVPTMPAALGPNPMALLMKFQGVLAQPNGLQKVLSHQDVVTSRASNPLVDEFCNAVEESGPMAGLAFIGRQDVINALAEVLPKVIDEVSA